VRKCAGNGEKFLLPLQVKLAKRPDEIVYAIFRGRDAITEASPFELLPGPGKAKAPELGSERRPP